MIDRVATTNDLVYRYGELLDDTGIARTDTTDGLSPILDEVDVLSLDNPALTDAVLADVARYKTLDVIVGRLAVAINTSDAEGSYQVNQEYTNAKALRDSYYSTVSWALASTPTIAETGGNEPGTIITISHPTTVDPDGWMSW